MTAVGARFIPDRAAMRGVANRPDVRDAGLALADAVADDARRLVPVDEGDLRDSIEAEPAGPSEDAVARVTAGGRDTFYAFLVEFGTADQPARPYLRPAAEAAGAFQPRSR